MRICHTTKLSIAEADSVNLPCNVFSYGSFSRSGNVSMTNSNMLRAVSIALAASSLLTSL